MTAELLQTLLERNQRHTDSLPADHFEAVQTGQSPDVVSMCCSDSRVSQEGMWAVTEPGWLFTPSTIGNQVWDDRDGERVVDGSVLYPLVHTDTPVAVVVGHTGCGAVTAALEAVKSDEPGDHPPGIEKWVELLRPVIEEGLTDDRIDRDRSVSLVDQLVEYNVDRQVAFLHSAPEIPEDVSVYGFVYDFQSVYGSVPGRTYLVNANGETDERTLQDEIPAASEQIQRLL